MSDEKMDPMAGTPLAPRQEVIPARRAEPIPGAAFPLVGSPRPAPFGIEFLARIKSYGVTATLRAMAREYDAAEDMTLAAKRFLEAWREYRLQFVQHESLDKEMHNERMRVAANLFIQEKDIQLEADRQLKRVKEERTALEAEGTHEDKSKEPHKTPDDPATAYLREIADIEEQAKKAREKFEHLNLSKDDLDLFEEMIESLKQHARDRAASRMNVRAQQSKEI